MPGLALIRRLPAVLALVAVLAGCQVKVATDIRAERDGSGVVTVGLGLDEAARTRLGDLDRQIRVGDLAAAGWKVGPAEPAADGFTWVRASKPFTSPAELNAVLAELTGEPAMFRDFRVTEEDAATAVLHRLTGTVDATRGMAAFADPQLGERLGGDPVADRVAAVEAEEGRSVADMVTIDVAASIDGEGAAYRARLDDREPIAVEAVARDAKPTMSIGGALPIGAMAVAGAVVVATLAGARRRFRRPPVSPYRQDSFL